MRPFAAVLMGLLVGVSAAGPAQTSRDTSRLRFVAESRQLGPVGYRDPKGVMSPDGQWLAFTSEDELRVTPLAGGGIIRLGPLSRPAAIVWLPDSKRLAALGAGASGMPTWSVTTIATGHREALWTREFPKLTMGSDSVQIDPRRFDDVAWSRDGARLAATMVSRAGTVVWTGRADGSQGRVQRISGWAGSLAWSPDGKTLACAVGERTVTYLSLPCGIVPPIGNRVQAYGPLAFSADGRVLYYAAPNDRGTLDLWSRSVAGGHATRLTHFARDTYAPSVAADGRVLFALQDYRTFVTVMSSDGGALRPLTTFQSETPSWSRDDRTIGVTFGGWRRFIDDLKYPDIAQDLGAVETRRDEPARAPDRVIRASSSEDQGMDWSPDGRWIVLHSHANGLDDVWIQPAAGSVPAHAITRGGYETGWPRWSPNGQWISYTTEVAEGGLPRGVIYVVGVDSSTAAVNREPRRLRIDGLAGDIDHGEWSPTSDSIAVSASDRGGERSIWVVSRDGGSPRLVHRFRSAHQFSGLGVAPDFSWAVFVAPATDGHAQLFRVPMTGGAATQLTFDPTDKTQPAVSHDGSRIAFTVFSYRMQFFVIE